MLVFYLLFFQDFAREMGRVSLEGELKTSQTRTVALQDIPPRTLQRAIRHFRRLWLSLSLLHSFTPLLISLVSLRSPPLRILRPLFSRSQRNQRTDNTTQTAHKILVLPCNCNKLTSSTVGCCCSHFTFCSKVKPP